MKKENLRQKSNVGIVIFLLLSTIITLCLMFPNWWFWYNDEFTYLSSGKCAQTWSDLLSFFIDGDTHHFTHTTSGPVFYRPINCIIATLEYWFFDTNAWYYHLTDVLVHACNASLIFYALNTITSILPSLCGALFFAFNPLIGYEFGRVDCLHIYLSTTCILACCLLLYRWTQSSQRWHYIAFCTLFTLSMLNRETTIVIPFLLTGALTLKQKRLTTLLTPWILLGSFLMLRFFMLKSATHHTIVSTHALVTQIKLWTLWLLQATYDFFGLGWLPEGYPLTRISILAVCIIGTIYYFLHSKNKRWLTLAIISAYAMLWPCFILGGYCMRYNYEALPFMLFFFALCWNAVQKNRVKKIVGFAIWGYIVFLITLCLYCFKMRETEFKRVHDGFDRFVVTLAEHKNRTLCFVRCPGRPFGNGIGKALNIFANIPENAVYHNEASVIHAPYLVNKGLVRIPYFFPKTKKAERFVLSLPESVTQANPLIISWNFETASFDY